MMVAQLATPSTAFLIASACFGCATRRVSASGPLLALLWHQTGYLLGIVGNTLSTVHWAHHVTNGAHG